MPNRTLKSQNDDLVDSVQAIDRLLSDGNIDKAASLCVSLTKSYPNQSCVWLWLSRISLILKKPKLAIDSALKSIEIDSQLIDNFVQLSKSYLSIHEWKNAHKAVTFALNLPPSHNADVLVDFAKTLFDTGEFDRSLTLYNRALNLSPNHQLALHNRALLHRFSGDFLNAEKDYQQLLTIQPNDYESYYELSQVKTWHQPNNIWLSQFEDNTNRNLSWKSQAYIEFAKGKFFEDQQQFKEACKHYCNGNNLVHSAVKKSNYSLTNDLDIHQNLPHLFSKTVLKHTGGLKSGFQPKNDTHSNQTAETHPLFILGMPRTGSTLIERILSNHSKIISGGELTSMPLAVMETVGLTALHDPFSIKLKHLQPPSDANKKAIKTRYLQLTNDKIKHGIDHQFIIDKLPFNDKFIGHIVSAFPNAKIICTDRNLMDTIISNYRMLFNHGYNYTYDLKQLKTYTQSHKHMMAQWQQLFPNNLHNLSYEALIKDPQKTVTEIFQFLGLPTENACFEFYKNKSLSQTASASQIRQPLHSQSINRWKQYQPYLTELTEPSDP